MAIMTHIPVITVKLQSDTEDKNIASCPGAIKQDGLFLLHSRQIQYGVVVFLNVIHENVRVQKVVTKLERYLGTLN